jgi:hypothetical protein
MSSDMGGRYDAHAMQAYAHGHDPHGHAMGAVMAAAEEAVMDRIPPNATLLQSLPPTHPSQQQQQQFSGSMHHPMAGYGTMSAMSANAGPPLMRRASDQSYDYHHRGPVGSSGGYSR